MTIKKACNFISIVGMVFVAACILPVEKGNFCISGKAPELCFGLRPDWWVGVCFYSDRAGGDPNHTGRHKLLGRSRSVWRGNGIPVQLCGGYALAQSWHF